MVFTWSTCYSCLILTKLEFSQQTYEKCSNSNFHENSSSGSRVIPCGWQQTWRNQQLCYAILQTRLKSLTFYTVYVRVLYEPLRTAIPFAHGVLGWLHTCNVTAYRNTVSWQCRRDSWPRNVSKLGYAVTLRACSMCCRYLVVASKGWYGYGRSRCGRQTAVATSGFRMDVDVEVFSDDHGWEHFHIHTHTETSLTCSWWWA
jgi:hypothetical protein